MKSFAWTLFLLVSGAVAGGEDAGSRVLDDLLGAAPAPPPPLTDAPAPPPLTDAPAPEADVQTTQWVDPNLPTTPAPVIAADAPACATNIAGALFKITRVARFLTLSTTDCAQPGYNSAVCGDDVTLVMQYGGELSTAISAATFDCGNIDSSCAQVISAAVGHLSQCTEKLVTLELACLDDLNCVVKVFDFLSNMVHAAKDIDTAIGQCQPSADGTKGAAAPAPPAPAPPPLADLENGQGAAPAPPPLGDSPSRLLLLDRSAEHGGLRGPTVAQVREASTPYVLPPDAAGLE